MWSDKGGRRRQGASARTKARARSAGGRDGRCACVGFAALALALDLALGSYSARGVRRRLEGGEADVHRGRGLARTAAGAACSRGPPLQRRSMRMIHPCALFPADLPVDTVVVLEQQE